MNASTPALDLESLSPDSIRAIVRTGSNAERSALRDAAEMRDAHLSLVGVRRADDPILSILDRGLVASLSGRESVRASTWLASGASATALNQNGNSALHVAASFGTLKAIPRSTVSEDALRTTNSEGLDLLQLATQWGTRSSVPAWILDSLQPVVAPVRPVAPPSATASEVQLELCLA